MITYIFESIRHQINTQKINDPELKNIGHITWSIPWELQKSLAELSRNGGIEKMLGSFTSAIYKKQNLIRVYQKKDIKTKIWIFISSNCVDFIVKVGVAYTVFQGTQSVGVMTMAVLYISKLSTLFRDSSKLYFDFQTIQFDLRLFDEFLSLIKPAGDKKGVIVKKEIVFE